jgi:septum formation protein
VILLASRSPQRRALLAALGVPFRVAVSRVAEGDDAQANALAKARDVAGRLGVPPGGAVLGADTEVVVDGRALGKPPDREGAAAMLRRLSGREHEVHSAIALVGDGRERRALAVVRVRVRELSPAAVDWYLDTGEWRERAGGYAIQGAGAALVERVEGDPTAVVGLPVAELVTALVELGLGPWEARER